MPYSGSDTLGTQYLLCTSDTTQLIPGATNYSKVLLTAVYAIQQPGANSNLAVRNAADTADLFSMTMLTGAQTKRGWTAIDLELDQGFGARWVSVTGVAILEYRIIK